jgi:diguanylate cyclase (GGDEF)-like protein
LVLQDRALSADLELAAKDRLDRAAHAADRLLENHLSAMLERYQAISQTPEFRANLEVNHSPTLVYFAKQLVDDQGASVILFTDRDNNIIASAGEKRRVALATDRTEEARVDGCTRGLSFPAAGASQSQGQDPSARVQAHMECKDSEKDGWTSFVADGKQLLALSAVPLSSNGQLVGHLVALENIPSETIVVWSELCGASVSLGKPDEPPRGGVTKGVRRSGELELRVSASLELEREALSNARSNLLKAGGVALALAVAASVILARGLIRPIREIQGAAENISMGKLDTRLRTDRPDEIGDVSRAFNLMLDRLHGSLAELRQSEERLTSAERLAHLGGFSMDPLTQNIQCSQEFSRIYSIDDPDDPISLDSLLSRVHSEDRESMRSALMSCLREGRPFSLDHRTIVLDGSERILHFQAERTVTPSGTPLIEGTVQDITQRKHVEEQVRYLAYHDVLTGLGNRRLLKENLSLSLNEARRESTIVAVLFIDLDGFKVINDTLGHSAGDHLLKRVANRLVKTVRSSDVIESRSRGQVRSMVSRFGGDEFTILLTGLGDPGDAGKVARRILQSLTEPFDLEDHEVVVSGSIGIATWPTDGHDVETLLRNCDTAMYHAKENGRNNFQFYADSMNAIIFKRLVLESKLRRAMERDELTLYYQPKVEIATGKVTGLEALARWRDPELGVVPPSEFIPVAEETGLIRAVGEWVLRAAIQQLKEWEESELEATQVSVNVSGYQLEQTSFGRGIGDLLEEIAIDPARLELEVTESALMKYEDNAVAALRDLKDLGVGLSLDDFGTGYSSLSYLRYLPIDTLKIDRSFVRQADVEPGDGVLIGAIISMAKILGLQVVVEGVETKDQFDLLLELGCDVIQGNLFSEPVPAEEVPRMIRELEAAKWSKRQRARRRSRRPPSKRSRG